LLFLIPITPDIRCLRISCRITVIRLSAPSQTLNLSSYISFPHFFSFQFIVFFITDVRDSMRTRGRRMLSFQNMAPSQPHLESKAPEASGRHSDLQYSKLCLYCQAISDRLMAVKHRQEAFDIEHYSGSPAAAPSDPSWPRPGRRVETFDHYRTENDLKSSANAGCALCARLLQGDRYGQPRRFGARRYSEVSLDEITAVLTFGPSRERADQWELMLRLGWDIPCVVNIYIKSIPNIGKLFVL